MEKSEIGSVSKNPITFYHKIFEVVKHKLKVIVDNSLILHIYIRINKHYHTYLLLKHAFYIQFRNNVK